MHATIKQHLNDIESPHIAPIPKDMQAHISKPNPKAPPQTLAPTIDSKHIRTLYEYRVPGPISANHIVTIYLPANYMTTKPQSTAGGAKPNTPTTNACVAITPTTKAANGAAGGGGGNCPPINYRQHTSSTPPTLLTPSHH
jgi:hypothetical protein